MSALPDEEIARRIREGSGGGFEAFFERFAPPLLAFLQRMVGDRASAEDLLQETMLRVLRHIDHYRETGSFRAWVYRIATNAALSHLRRGRVFPIEPASVLEGRPDPRALDPALSLERRETERTLRAALHRLPEEHRTVLLLRMGEGMALAEIADVLCVPEGTVKSRLHYAVLRLRESFARAEAGSEVHRS